jgi:hypothetical protein
MKHFNSLTLCLLFLTFNLFANTAIEEKVSQNSIPVDTPTDTVITQSTPIQEADIPKEQRTISAEIPEETPVIKELMVGYYGRPYAKSLGILGQSNIEQLVAKIRNTCGKFEQLENTTVKPAFHIIYGLATIEEGRDGDHVTDLKESILMQYIQAAQKENFAVIIDLQLGTLTPLQAVQPVLKFLQYDNVHLALDPEFKIPTHKRYPPGKFVGHIFGQDVNEVQEAMNDYLSQNNLGKRKLLVHMFMDRMLRKREVIKNYENVDLVFNIDGHGRAGTKVKIYNALYSPDNAKIARSGFKIFYKADIGPLATPRQIMGLDNVGSRRIQIPPIYINFQ